MILSELSLNHWLTKCINKPYLSFQCHQFILESFVHFLVTLHLLDIPADLVRYTGVFLLDAGQSVLHITVETMDLSCPIKLLVTSINLVLKLLPDGPEWKWDIVLGACYMQWNTIREQTPYIHEQTPYMHEQTPYIHEQTPYEYEQAPYTTHYQTLYLSHSPSFLNTEMVYVFQIRWSQTTKLFLQDKASENGVC